MESGNETGQSGNEHYKHADQPENHDRNQYYGYYFQVFVFHGAGASVYSQHKRKKVQQDKQSNDQGGQVYGRIGGDDRAAQPVFGQQLPYYADKKIRHYPKDKHPFRAEFAVGHIWAASDPIIFDTASDIHCCQRARQSQRRRQAGTPWW